MKTPRIPGKTPTVVSPHAVQRFVERVLRSPEEKHAIDAFGGQEAIEEIMLQHFAESVPATLIVEDKSQHDGESVRIHPETFTCWIHGDRWNESEQCYHEILVTCWQYGERRVSLAGYSLCDECGRLTAAQPDESTECDHCGAHVIGDRDDPLADRLESNPLEGSRRWVPAPSAAEWIGVDGTLETGISADGPTADVVDSPKPIMTDGGDRGDRHE